MNALCARCGQVHFPTTPKGEHNFVCGSLGVPDTGKTTKAAEVLWSFHSFCFLLAIDPSMEMPDTLPDGTKLPNRYYRSIDEVEEGLATAEGQAIHVLQESRDLLGMIALAKRLARASLLAHTEDGRIQRGTPGIPVMLFADELHVFDECRLGKVPHKEIVELVGCRRPNHVGFIWTTQMPTMINHLIVELTPRFQFGRIDDGMQVKELRRRSIPEKICDMLPSLPDHKFLSYRRGQKLHDVKVEGSGSGATHHRRSARQVKVKPGVS